MPRKPVNPQYAGWLGSYWPIKPSNTLQGRDPRLRPGQALPQSQRDRRTAFIKRTKEAVAEKQQRNPDGVGHGEKAYALLRRRSHPSPNIGEFWDVVALRRERSALPARPGSDERICAGWLCITNQSIESKHSERFFFRESANHAGAAYINLPDHVRGAYETLIADYQERHAKAMAKRAHPDQKEDEKPAFSRFICQRDERRLQDGALVYAMLHGDPNMPVLEFIAPVSVPRILYGKSPLDLLPDHLRRCHKYEELCPACRLFGWVHANPEGKLMDVRTAYASRLRFSHGAMVENKGTIGETSLAILSSPKPTTTAFYLLDVKGKPSKVDYDTEGARLRGRKVYRHHGKYAEWTEAQRAEVLGHVKSDQNRTVRDALEPGARFTFEIDFENLAAVELGALLWSLELEDGMYHRLGFAKPLGFGSIAVRVQKLEILQPAARYQSLNATGLRQEERPASKGWPWVEQFKTEMAAYYAPETKNFNTLDPVLDLMLLLSKPVRQRIHYPRATDQPTADGENFKWFVGNKRNLERNNGQGQWLPLPEEEHNGSTLRLVDAKRSNVP